MQTQELIQTLQKVEQLLPNNFTEALDLLFAAENKFPNSWEINFNIGSLKLNSCFGMVPSIRKIVLEGALEQFRLSEIKGGKEYALFHNRGCVYRELNQFADAISCYHKALEINPLSYETMFQLGTCLIMTATNDDQLREGYKLLESRYKYSPLRERLKLYKAPIWNGEPLKDKKILVFNEQGRGDFIQNLRFIPLLKEMGAIVHLECVAELESIAKQHAAGVKLELVLSQKLAILNNLVPGNDAGFDYVISINSLYFMLFPEISGEPYLKIHNKKIKFLDEFDNKFKVGVCWQGSPTHQRDKSRSIPSHYFNSLGDVDLFSLQHRTPKNINTCNIHQLDSSIKDIEDLANIIQYMDLVITVDTVVAHLAGAMGKTVWMLVGDVSDYRWGVEGFTTPWYKTMTIIRSSDWEETFANLKNAISNIREKHAQL